MTLEEKIELFLREFHSVEGKASFDPEYQDQFANEGRRKAQYILDDLRAKSALHKFDMRDTAFLSIGGADGSEAEAILANSAIDTAVLLEISYKACEAARKRTRRLAIDGKTLRVIEGDAIGRLDEAIKFIEQKGAKGLVVSSQAILHELPSRSSSFRDMNRLLGKLLSAFPFALLYAREPCSPPDWPSEVEVKVPGVSGDVLRRLLTMVAVHLRLDEGSVQKQPHDFVLANGVLVVETLHKLLRCKSIEDFKYEMKERLTSIDAEHVRDLLLNFCEDPTRVSVDPVSTEGFKSAYAAAKVCARAPGSKRLLPVPHTHVIIKAVIFQNHSTTEGRGSPILGHARERRPRSCSLDGILSKVTPRRGRIRSGFSFRESDNHLNGIRVRETSDYSIVDSKSPTKPYFQFGASKGEILEINRLSFAVQVGPNMPHEAARKEVVFLAEPATSSEKMQLLNLVTEPHTPDTGAPGRAYIGLLKWVPLELVERGYRMMTEADYVVPADRLFTWRVGMATEGYELSIAFPSMKLGIQIEPFIRWTAHETDSPDLRRYTSDDWIAPENGIVWRFIPVVRRQASQTIHSRQTKRARKVRK